MGIVENKKVIPKHRKQKLILMMIIFVVSIICIVSFFEKTKSQTTIKNGVLDLQHLTLGTEGSLNLDGQWNFYWNRFVTDQEIENGNAKPDVIANAPAPWNNYKINGKNLPSFGYGTYALKVLNAKPGQKLALNIPAFSTAYKLYVDGILLASNGKVGTSKETFAPEAKPQVVEFSPTKQNFEIVIYVSNYTCVQGGMIFGVQMGTAAQIQIAYIDVFGMDSFILGILIIVALYYIGMFMVQREVMNGLYTSFICLLMAVRTITTGNVLILHLIPTISYGVLIAIDYISLCWIPTCAILIFKDLFPEEMSDKVKKISLIYAIAMTLLILLTPNSFFSPLSYIIELALAPIGVYIIFVLSKAYLHGRKDSFAMLLTILLFLVCATDDTLFMNNANEIGYLIILFLQPFVISGRLSGAFKDIKEMSKKLLSLDKLKDEFLANTSHELRTPLNGILSIAEAMLRGGDGELSDKQRYNLTLITMSSRRLANLVNDILDYEKLKNGDILLNVQPVYIEGLIYTILSIFRQLTQSENIEILYTVSEGLPPVLADESRLTQILYNLLDNAVKFTVSGYVKITIRETGNMLEFCVSDTGQGIPEEMLETIFKSFEQVDTSLTRRRGGTGLGLPITKHFVELMGGAIWVNSKLGIGSIFTFTIPIATESSGDLIAAQKKISSEIAAINVHKNVDENNDMPTGAPKILLVDDDIVNLQAASSILRIGGFRVVTARSGLAALAQLEKSSDYSLVILDVMMPEMSGFELCRKIREHKICFELPVLMLTARTATKDIVMGFDVGANDYLPKPFETEELLARARMLTGLKASVDLARSAETAFLQAQIKPHFLFNTLNAISSFCDTDPECAQRLIDDFSNYLRHCFDFKSLESTCPLENELNLVKSYVSIQNTRFGDQLNVKFDIDSMVYVRIPQFSIQPLVENAISHGLRKMGGKGMVVVSVKRRNESIHISVEDDGQGIKPDKLDNLLEKGSGRGIGLWNINRRLKVLYGHGLKIVSAPGKGTTVFFDIPSGGQAK